MSNELHPDVEELLDYFEFGHLPTHLQEVSALFHDLAQLMAWDLNTERTQEVVAGLRKLLESKDCFVRAATKPRKEKE